MIFGLHLGRIVMPLLKKSFWPGKGEIWKCGWLSQSLPLVGALRPLPAGWKVEFKRVPLDLERNSTTKSMYTCSSPPGALMPYGLPPCTRASSMYLHPPFVGLIKVWKIIFLDERKKPELVGIQWKSGTDAHDEKVCNTVSLLIEIWLRSSFFRKRLVKWD